jgi:A/G-specific adenine glycosylase
MTLSAAEVKKFQRTVYEYYRAHGRILPWRTRATPYRVLVSEVMLQQTQVDRAIPFFQSFLRTFPTVRVLACASRRQVLAAWQGLGYNRRALYLWRCAQGIVRQYGGKVPADPETLARLPGIGPATAASIAAFAYNAPTVFIETNIRSVFIHHFFCRARRVSDARILPLVAQTLDRACPARWYSALMDYGVFLKKEHKNPSRKSARHVRQEPFIGSTRQLRGMVLAFIVRNKKATQKAIARACGMADVAKVIRVADTLVAEGLVEERKGVYYV